MDEPLDITQLPSPNFGTRRGGAIPNLVVVHFTAMQSCEAALERLCTPEHEVSAHYLISRSGAVFQLVQEDMRAWHAGRGTWGACSDVNSNSIGIELDNSGHEPFSEPLMAALERLLSDVMKRNSILPARVIGHSDMAPQRKSDPGKKFDWNRLAHQGLSVWPNAKPCDDAGDMAEWSAHAKTFGYGIDETCAESQAAYLSTFRDRFRNGAYGPLECEDLRIIQNLAQRFPVDDQATNA